MAELVVDLVFAGVDELFGAAACAIVFALQDHVRPTLHLHQPVPRIIGASVGGRQGGGLGYRGHVAARAVGRVGPGRAGGLSDAADFVGVVLGAGLVEVPGPSAAVRPVAVVIDADSVILERILEA